MADGVAIGKDMDCSFGRHVAGPAHLVIAKTNLVSPGKEFEVMTAAQTVDVHLFASVQLFVMREYGISVVCFVDGCVFSTVDSSPSGGVLNDSL